MMSEETRSAPLSLWWFIGFLILAVLIYAPVIAVLLLFARRAYLPAALGLPYIRGSR